MSDFKRLKVWRKAHALSLAVGDTVRGIRGRHTVSLRRQLVDAASSIPINIVEGKAKRGDREFARFLEYSIASSAELEYRLLEARDLRLIGKSQFKDLVVRLIEVRKMLFGLQRTVRGEKPDEDPKS